MKNNLLNLILLAIGLYGCTENEVFVQEPQLIPIPQSLERTDGYFELNDQVYLVAESFVEEGEFLQKLITNAGVKEITDTASKSIRLEKNEALSDEEYTLTIQEKDIAIAASTSKGIYHGIQTFRQLLPPCVEDASCNEGSIYLPNLIIKDAPRFGYRGMHLDVGRHFFDVEDIKKYIDMIAMLKMNTFHWHLTEDQGWRIEIKKYPKLTSVGAYRNETLVGHYNDQPHQFDGKRYGGFYTQEQVKEIVAYANGLNITVIPEIELPGHSQAAIAAYPHLGCTGEQIDVATKWGIFEEIYCPKEETFQFLQDVLDEVMELFPSEYIHIGGDEAPKIRWKQSDFCQELIKKEGLVDEHGLQSYFIKRIETYLNSKGRKIIGWDEILEGGLAPNATVMSWRGVKGAVDAAKQGHQVILSPTSHCYFDYYQHDGEEEPLAIGGFLPLEKVYGFEPIPSELNVEESKNVWGTQGNVWTEYMPDYKKVQYMAYPRMMALSEVAWSQKENMDYLDFVSRLAHFQERLDVMGINYANHLYEVHGNLPNAQEQQTFELSTLLSDKDIRYTTNGKQPTKESPVYSYPIPVGKSVTIKAAVFEDTKQLGSTFSQDLHMHKAVGKEVSLAIAPNKTYDAGGKQALVNSINGSNSRFGDQEWLGFWGDNIEAVIDLGEETPIKEVKTRFFNANGQWIYAPKALSVSFSLDGKTFDKAQHVAISKSDDSLVPVTATFEPVSTRYLKIQVEKYGLIPDGKQGAGNQAWTFIDEIHVN